MHSHPVSRFISSMSSIFNPSGQSLEEPEPILIATIILYELIQNNIICE